ncbi:reprolysin-like metallopeptidase [Wenzhouxiangella sp. EGI_FJ10305]|uniref:reprolysin-like metallopeptidase n=1 Tax=Wenzhouxiangella sp. EGI_FJ10305 TaxID=3243768 RepID=UPI0035D5CD57
MTNSWKTLIGVLVLGLVTAWWWPGPESSGRNAPQAAGSAGAAETARSDTPEQAATRDAAGPHRPRPAEPRRLWSAPARSPDQRPAPGSGFAGLPDGLVQQVEVVTHVPAIGEPLALELPDEPAQEVIVRSRFRHPNGDVSVHARAGGSAGTQATLTVGRDGGLFGRIRVDQALYLVHSDASGSWLVDLDDERVDVDDFHGDTLGQSLSADAQTGEALDGPAGQSAGEATSRIDVMFVYTPDMLERYPDGLIETRLNHLVAIANQAMVDSAVGIVVELVHHRQIGYPAQKANGPTLRDLARALDGESVTGMSGLKADREAHGADIVALTWPHDIETRGSCGMARFPRPNDSGDFDPARGVHIDNDGASNWSVCSDSVFTHELGHNLNAEHQRGSASEDDPDRANYAFVRDGRFHTIMGSFGTGDVNRYQRLDVFSNSDIQCGGEACGSVQSGAGADNAAMLRQLGPVVAAYAGESDPSGIERPAPSSRDSDGDGRSDRDDPYPFDPYDGQTPPQVGPVTDFAPRELKAGTSPGSHELLVVSSGSDQVLSFSPEGGFRGVAVAPEAANAGPILTEYSDMRVDDAGRIWLLASGDVRRFDRLSGRLIDVFLGSTRPEPADLASAFPRAFARLPQDRFVVLGDNGIERFNAATGKSLAPPPGGEPTQEPDNWRDAMDLPLRGVASWRQSLYVAEAANNRIMTFSIGTGARRPDLADSVTAPIEDPWALRVGPDGLLYLANGRADNILRFDPDGGFVDEFVASGAGGLDFARDLAFAPGGDLYVTSHAGDAVLRFDGQTGEYVETVVEAGEGGLDGPVALAIAPVVDELHAGHSGHFFVPTRSGEGWLLEILDEATAAISWFTYPPEGADRDQAWMVGVGDIEGNRIVFEDLVETRGGPFGPDFDPADLEERHWGRLELEFSNCNNGKLRYQAQDESWGGGQQRFTRLIGIEGTPCGALARSPADDAPGISGQWYDPDRNGQGWFLEESAPGRVFVAWYTYDGSGDPAWIVGEGELDGNALVFDDLAMPAGTRFGDDFDVDAIESRHWGTMTMDFVDCERALVEYDSVIEAFGQGSMNAARLTTLSGLECFID